MKKVTEEQYKEALKIVEQYREQKNIVRVIKKRKGWWTTDLPKNSLIIVSQASEEDVRDAEEIGYTEEYFLMEKSENVFVSNLLPHLYHAIIKKEDCEVIEDNVLTIEQANKAIQFYQHKSRTALINEAVSRCGTSFSPSGEDKNDPALWKTSHWHWFFSTYFKNGKV